MLDDVLDKAAQPGLRERDPRASFQVIKPAQWLRRAFDPISQCLSWLLRDPSGRVLELHLPFDEVNRPAIERLERFSAQELEDCKLVGRCQRINGILRVFPLALMTPVQIMGVFFAIPAAGSQIAVSAHNPSLPDASELEEPELEEIPSTIPGGALGQVILSATSSLEWIAETGMQNQNGEARSRLKEAAVSLEQLGTRNIASFVELTAASPQPSTLLKLRWVLMLSEKSMTR